MPAPCGSTCCPRSVLSARAGPEGAGDVALRSLAMMLGNARETEIGAWADRHQVFVLPAPSTAGVSPSPSATGAG